LRIYNLRKTTPLVRPGGVVSQEWDYVLHCNYFQTEACPRSITCILTVAFSHFLRRCGSPQVP